MHAKFPETTWPLWLGFLVMAIVMVGLCRWSRWFYLVTIPLSLFTLYQGVSFLHANVSFRNAMIQELGFSYFVQFACSYGLPILSLACYGYYDWRYRKVKV